jgi:hypothetical protein
MVPTPPLVGKLTELTLHYEGGWGKWCQNSIFGEFYCLWGERHSDAGPPCITPSLNFIQERGTALGKKKFNSEKFDICT